MLLDLIKRLETETEYHIRQALAEASSRGSVASGGNLNQES